MLVSSLFTASLLLNLSRADDGLEFFESRIRPILVEHCYKCHSAESQEIKGELRLDLMAGWQEGGESGEPAVVPGQPDESPLIHAVRHERGASAMPPQQARLSERMIDDLTVWIEMGAPDPRQGNMKPRDEAAHWETELLRRLDWWSMKPLAQPSVPQVRQTDWPLTEVDRFILSKLEALGLAPARPAVPRTLARRLSFALTGLPPTPELVERFAAATEPQAYDDLVAVLLESPHFGERWARHWMDVVHYSDTHGYEWDVPAKNAWRYRDYLIRAFNADVPYNQLVMEHIAGDLIAPRMDPVTGLNESLIGPMSLRLGERRHGDSAFANGVAQEAVTNMVDTLGKALLGTTLACAQCHDHKLDAVEQRDYYALAGMLMSTRFSARSVEAGDPNRGLIEELRSLKLQLHLELSKLWLEATAVEQLDSITKTFTETTVDEQPVESFPSSLIEFWLRSVNRAVTADEFRAERTLRISHNRQQLTLLADFTGEQSPGGWRWEGWGMQHGATSNGDLVVAEEGDFALRHILPAGRFTHVWSPRLAGALQSPQLETAPAWTMSLEVVAGNFASQALVVDRALHSERMQFMDHPALVWRTLTAGNFDTLEGSTDTVARRVYLELATKSLNNYFPPRVGYGGVSEAELSDPRSWFGVTRVYRHPAGQPPLDELSRFEPLFDETQQDVAWAERLRLLLYNAVARWSQGKSDSQDVRLLNEGLRLKLLPNGIAISPKVARLVELYRAREKLLQTERTIGTVADWSEGRDERIGIRGSYTELGPAVERGLVRFMGKPANRSQATTSSGRLQWAKQIVDERNPLTARVYVNRVWLLLFGQGLVRTPDDFGHLGALPTHPELLDFLASRFVQEGWSTKQLIRQLVTSATWRQCSVPDRHAIELDPENRLWHHSPMRRLEAEAIRDSLLAVSGHLDGTLFGAPIEPYRTAEDSQKRLVRGPLDGEGRRSIYLKMTLMEPPRFLALFNQPLPKQCVGQRDVTNVPDQALALLNDPFVIEMARQWSQRLISDQAIASGATAEQRLETMVEAALGRPAGDDEIAGLLQLVRRSAELRGMPGDYLECQPAWQDAAHAIFNLKEFLYVP